MSPAWSPGQLEHPHCAVTRDTSPPLQFDAETCGDWSSPHYVTSFSCPGNPELFPEAGEREHRVHEARLSFLSGHASLAWYGMVWAAGYLHLLASRLPRRYTLPLGVLQVGVYSVLAMARVLTSCRVAEDSTVSLQYKVRVQAGLLAYCALVAVSRVADNKHHATDVVAGALLGAAVALLALVRVAPRSCGRERGEETELRSQAQVAGSLSLVTEDRP